MIHAGNKFIVNEIRIEYSRVIQHRFTKIKSRGDDYNKDDVKELIVVRSGEVNY